MNPRKALLLSLGILSCLPILLLPFPEYGTSSAATPLYISHIASRIGLMGGILMLWSYLLGIRRITGRFIEDQIWINKIHKWIGMYGFVFIALHPLLIVYSLSESFTYALFAKELIEYEFFVSTGRLAFILLTFIWFTSALIRGKMSYRLWKILHYSTYLILPLVFIHGLKVGSILNSNEFIRTYWIFLIVVFVISIIVRIIFEFGVGKKKYKVIQIKEITHDTHEYVLEAVNEKISPKPGQYGYISRKPFGESHPFTIARSSEDGKTISFSIKSLGKFTKILRELQVGDMLLIDGPYGVFGQKAIATHKPVVYIAGGIGITPFLRLIDVVNDERELIMIFGNKTPDDIPYKEELEKKLGKKLVHVLSHCTEEQKNSVLQLANQPCETEFGFVTIDLIKKYIGEEVNRYEYFICGPPIMMKLVSEALYKAGVEKRSVDMEKFSM